MAGTRIDQKVQYALWARSAGRCQFRNCPEVLTGDLLSNKADGKFGYVAHVIGDVPKSKDGKDCRAAITVRPARQAG